MPVDKRLITRNKYLFYWVTCLEYLFFNDAVLILFGHDYLGLSYFRAGSLFFIGFFVSIILDFWGGVVADKVGHKQTAILGLTLQGVSYIPFLVSKSYLVLILASVVWGIGIALSSNSLHALMYEQTADSRGKLSYNHISATSQIWLFLGVGAATVIGGYAYTIDPRLPYAMTMVAVLIAAGLASLIRVVGHSKKVSTEEESKVSVIKEGIGTFTKNKPLRNFIIICFLAGLFGDMLFGYYQPFYINLGVSAVTLGILFGGLRLASASGSYLMRRLPDTAKHSTIQVFNLAAMVATACLMLVLKLPLVLAAPIIFGISSGFVEPNLRLYVNKHASDSARASAISFGTMTLNFGIGIGFVVAYYLADRTSAQVVLCIVITGCLVTLALRGFYSRRAAHQD